MFIKAQNSGIPVDEKMYTNMIGYYGKAASILFHGIIEERNSFFKSQSTLLFVISDF